MDEKKDEANRKEQEVKKPVKNAVDLQKLKLEKLFKNIERPVHLPEPLKKRGFSNAPEFVRNVMGSSAGAGSGEFHVYRHIRRRENARLKFIAEEAVKEDKDEAYQRKLEENRAQSEQRTAKKRAKRQKKKGRQQGREKRPKVAAPSAAPAGEDGSGSDEDESGSEPEPEPERQTAEGDRVPAAGRTAGSDVGPAAVVSDPVDGEGAQGGADPAEPAAVVTAADPADGGASTARERDTIGDAGSVLADSAEAGPDNPASDDHSAAEEAK